MQHFSPLAALVLINVPPAALRNGAAEAGDDWMSPFMGCNKGPLHYCWGEAEVVQPTEKRDNLQLKLLHFSCLFLRSVEEVVISGRLYCMKLPVLCCQEQTLSSVFYMEKYDCHSVSIVGEINSWSVCT